ncbi:response regulator transcription factor [Halovulum dunhuangense]|uniref:Response regulator transcription factor n=1 Tax=Halovulum dunhuangense TaxID=1505036 RepID=A0A849L6Y1_9RHOB|nr:response regulator transcription factor [Halovulum dunhuangense]NNU82003.1 response regulator transcription factor [Halovulum dunhuangense]
MRRVMIVEDIPATRRWLAGIVAEAFPGSLINESATLRDGRAAARTYAPTLALIDLGLPDGSGLDVLRDVLAHNPDATCVVSTVMGDDAHVVAALAAGAGGYLLKEQPRELLVRQLRQIAEGIPALSPSIARRLMEHFRLTGPAAPAVALTARETDVLALIGRGMRNSEVARHLGLSDHTVSSYIKGIYRKLGISSRAEASWHATRLGLGTRWKPPTEG